ncbi:MULTISPECIES: DUF4175 family protein [Paracoccus]|uniref:DUF4175 domain-containing protein n=1 Tax=Paracoccus TaxID=265 RepID=UPI00086F6350|nr:MULTISPECIES: DUF4175 family protein [Paracoccus]ODT59725.1 MAG: hypothetical protein ABS73_08645 [Paracoccus sp. SCN 68-21]
MAQGPVARALRLTRYGMVWERGARAFWPLATLMAFGVAALALGAVAALPDAVLPWLVGLWLLAVIAAAGRGGWLFRRVRRAEAVARLDGTLPGRPLTALTDRPAIGGDGPLWQAHLAQMRDAAMAARAVRPDADLAPRDPYALRLAGMVALVMALIFGGGGQVGQGLRAIAATVNPPVAGTALPTGPLWEGWAEPPAYTRRPTIYLNAWAEGQPLDLPKGSAVSFRLYGGGAEVVQDIGPPVGDDPTAPAFRAEQSGSITVAGWRLDVTVLPDAVPVIRAGAAPTRRADGRMIQDFEAEDDHGIVLAQAQIALDLEAVDRRFGLAIAPEPREAVALDLPLPRGDRRAVQGQLAEDLSRHPWANLPVRITLRAVDGIEQVGQSDPMALALPGRRFFNPFAATLIEMRRDLLWSRDNAGRTAEILRAVTWQPDGFVADDLYAELRGAVGLLEGGALAPDDRDRLAEALWEAAVQLEDGGLADALQRMRAAQERLSEAIRNGASPDEIQRLMDELREATEAYTDMLAQQSQQQDQTDSPDRGGQQGQTITGDQIQQMMDEIQRLMNEGRMAEAEALLEQFNRMMENLQVQQSQGQGQGEGQQGSQPMNRLADTLREQQQLSDEAFRDMQRQFGQGEQPGEGGDSLADRQRSLREDLGQQQGLMPGQGSPEGDAARRQLDEAGRAMEEAEQALRDGDPGQALQRQADAIQSMREGMRALGDMLAQQGQEGQQSEQGQDGQQPGQQPGQTAQGGPGQQPYQGQPMLDPLGRESSGGGNVITNGDPLAEGADPARRARDLLDEIRRRSGQPDRPQDERDYLGRLLDRF